MEAGRELDAKVATEVMGWRRCQNDGSGYWEGRSPTNILNLVLEEVPYFSSDIAAAWQVVEAMLAHGFFAALERAPDDDWEVTFEKGHGAELGYQCGIAVNVNVCAAICKAALKALGIRPTVVDTGE